jgi:hypothetical protein
MKKLTLTFLTCLIFFSPNVVMSETMDDLVKREGLWYKKFSQVSFTGKVTGTNKGAFKNGKKEGAWVDYHINGQLLVKINYKNGKRDGAWIGYYDNGQLWYKGNYKNGKKEGTWVVYWKNGQLWDKGNYKIGKREGIWVGYDVDGTVWKEYTGTYKNGKKISD